MTRSGTHAPVSGVTIILLVVSAYAHYQGQFLYLVLVPTIRIKIPNICNFLKFEQHVRISNICIKVN